MKGTVGLRVLFVQGQKQRGPVEVSSKLVKMHPSVLKRLNPNKVNIRKVPENGDSASAFGVRYR